MRLGRLWPVAAVTVTSVVLAVSCSWFGSSNTVLVRSDPPLNGMQASVQYKISSTGNNASEVNQAVYQGLNDNSPLPLLTTTFGRGAGVKTQTVQATSADGTAENVLGMTKRTIQFGLTDFLVADVATYETRDASGSRTCGAKVRMTFQPILAQRFLQDRLGRAWDALWYYSITCEAGQDRPLPLGSAKLTGLVINQVFNLRVTGRPIVWNRGHSVTVVGGTPAGNQYPGGWWTSNANILKAAALIRDMTKDLDNGDNQWLQFTPGKFGDAALVYSAGDADVYNLKRFILNRQSDYVVNFRASPNEAWRRIIVRPQYNIEWNDIKQNWKAVKGQAFPDIDDKVDDKTGLPKDLEDAELKEVETAGCQNCPNATLEQIQLIDANTGQPIYAMTIRGYLGANSSLVMFGQVPQRTLKQSLQEAERRRQDLGYTSCPVRRGEDGKELSKDEQMTPKRCAELLREGSLWDLITQDPARFGFDVVGQFQVRDNSTWASVCTGSGESTSCSAVPTEHRLDASYLFNRTDDKLQAAWTVLQLLGEVGVRTLGMSYASNLYSGSGLLFAMEQPMMFRQYFAGLSNPEMVFALDARALQLPQTLAAAGQVLFPSR